MLCSQQDLRSIRSMHGNPVQDGHISCDLPCCLCIEDLCNSFELTVHDMVCLKLATGPVTWKEHDDWHLIPYLLPDQLQDLLIILTLLHIRNIELDLTLPCL